MYQDGMIRESVSLLASDLEPEELVFVKAHLSDWDTPIAPCQPPPADEWDPRTIDSTDRRTPGQILGDDLMPIEPRIGEPPEAPQVEELPEPARSSGGACA